MWKINISMEDAAQLSDLLRNYQKLIAPEKSDERSRTAKMKSKLDDLLVAVSEENRVVADYLESIRKSQESKAKIG